MAKHVRASTAPPRPRGVAIVCHGVQRCTGARFLLSGDGFCPRRYGEARAGKHCAAAAAPSGPSWPRAITSYTHAPCACHGLAFESAPHIDYCAARWITYADFVRIDRPLRAPARGGGGIKHGGLYVLAATTINVQRVGSARSTSSNCRFCVVHACGICNTSQGESDWCPDVTSTHGVQRCTGVGFLLSGGGFCPRRHGEARAGKHGAAAAPRCRIRFVTGCRDAQGFDSSSLATAFALVGMAKHARASTAPPRPLFHGHVGHTQLRATSTQAHGSWFCFSTWRRASTAALPVGKARFRSP